MKENPITDDCQREQKEEKKTLLLPVWNRFIQYIYRNPRNREREPDYFPTLQLTIYSIYYSANRVYTHNKKLISQVINTSLCKSSDKTSIYNITSLIFYKRLFRLYTYILIPMSIVYNIYTYNARLCRDTIAQSRVSSVKTSAIIRKRFIAVPSRTRRTRRHAAVCRCRRRYRRR